MRNLDMWSEPGSQAVVEDLAAAAQRPPITICYPFAGDSLGGSHHSMLGLLRLLDRSRFRPLIVLDKGARRLAEHFAGFDIVSDPAPPRPALEPGRSIGIVQFAKTLADLRARAQFLHRNKIKLVHTNDGRTHAAWALAARLGGCKLLWHHRADPNARGLRLLAPLVADRVVSVSRFSLPRNRLTRSARVVFSPFEIDLKVDRQAARQRLLADEGLPADALICGFFGSFIARKRPLAFIDAIAQLRLSLDRPVFGLMFGEASHVEIAEQMRKRMGRADVADGIRLMGYRSPGWEWIAGCDVLLAPAVAEPLGRTLVEAMLVGTPVVATISGGNAEAILPGLGRLVPPDDPDALARACAEIVADPHSTAEMVAAARISARERFAAHRHVAAITSLYDELAGKAGEPTRAAELAN